MNEPSNAYSLNHVLKLAEEANEPLNIRNSFNKILENTNEEVAFSKSVYEKCAALQETKLLHINFSDVFQNFENTLRWLLPE